MKFQVLKVCHVRVMLILTKTENTFDE